MSAKGISKVEKFKAVLLIFRDMYKISMTMMMMITMMMMVVMKSLRPAVFPFAHVHTLCQNMFSLFAQSDSFLLPASVCSRLRNIDYSVKLLGATFKPKISVASRFPEALGSFCRCLQYGSPATEPRAGR